MAPIALRTQLLIATIAIVFALTGATLLIIRHTVSTEIQAILPTLQALMGTEHAPTIQDGSEIFWKLSGSDLFVLAKPDRQIMAVHVNQPRWSLATSQRELARSLDAR